MFLYPIHVGLMEVNSYVKMNVTGREKLFKDIKECLFLIP